MHDYPHYGWIPAKQLKPGMHLKTVNGTVAVVVGGIAPKQHDGWMWDLTVPLAIMNAQGERKSRSTSEMTRQAASSLHGVQMVDSLN
jgi:hypothetical protein